MKNNKQEPVQVVLTYNPNSEKDNLRAKIVTSESNSEPKVKTAEDFKQVRRYSFDDNGGGYLGL